MAMNEVAGIERFCVKYFIGKNESMLQKVKHFKEKVSLMHKIYSVNKNSECTV
jgi:hypothetical protein